MRFTRFTSCTAALSTAVVGFTVVVSTTTPAQALQSQVPANTASSWQTNGSVTSMAYAAGTVFLGGDFTSVRPPGSAAGTGEVPRNHLAAFDAATGALKTSFAAHTFSSSVRSLGTNPAGTVLYVGGDFTSVDSTVRNHIAAFATDSGALTAWNPNASNRVSAIAATATTVYLGGTFLKVGARAEQRVAAVGASGSGVPLTSFTASADNLPYQMALSTDGSRLYLAGAFQSLDGNTDAHAAGAVNAATGALLPFSAGSVIPPKTTNCVVEAKSVKTDANGVYFGVEGTGGGCFDGTFAANADGTLKWRSSCLGATQAVQPLGGVLYTGSHSHDCIADQPGGASGLNDPDAFPEVGWSKGLSRHLLSRSTIDGKLGSWYPNTNGGPNSGGLGPRSMASDGKQLFVGGEFTTVNGQAQQGFARFSPSTGDKSLPAVPVAPTAVARGGGKVSVFVKAPLDIDDPDLTVELYRDSGTTPIATKNVHSLFWRDPIVGFTDDGQAVGSKHTYRIDAKEINGSNVGPKSAAGNTVTVVSAAPSYAASVMAGGPTSYWRLDDTHAPAVADSSDQLEGGTSFGGVTFNQPGATADGSTAITTDGITGIVSSTDAMPSPATFSVEAWFKTTTTSGGKIIGFGNRQQGYDFSGNPAMSSSYDKHVYMTNDGRLVFGVYNGGTTTLTAGAKAYNDGAWHQVVGTQGPAGMAFYVDGARMARNAVTTNQAYTGYWRVGGDNLGSWPNQPASNYFAGSIDEVATYNHAISLSDVQAQYAASGRTPPPSALPTDTYGRAVAGDSPSAYWRLDEASGTQAADASDNGDPATYVAGVAQGQAGALGTQGTATTFDGSSGNVAESTVRHGPGAFSTELWFRTKSQSGGKLIGFGDASTGMSGSYDKQVYMVDDGRLIFGTYNGGFDTIVTTGTFNDDQWHYLVATQGSNGMALYVDNTLIGTNATTTSQAYDGYWRVGGDNLNAWPEQPSSAYFAGTIDEVAVYDAALSANQVNGHYIAAGRNGRDTTAPLTAITSPHEGDVVNTGQVAVSATATDDVGVTSVDLVVDGTKVATATAAPYTFNWTAPNGPHALQTIAHDAAGNDGQSAKVEVSATTPDTTAPTTQITSPADGASVSGATTVTATASDDRGVTSVALQVDGATVGTTTSAPYSFTWNATTPGSHTLRTIASDAAGNHGQSAAVAVTVATGGPLFSDTWSAPNGTAWNSGWTTTQSGGTVDTQNSQGRLTYGATPSAYARAQLTGAAAQADSELLTSYQWDSVTAGGYLSVFLRGSGGWQNAYRPKNGFGMQFASSSSTAVIQKNVNSVSTNLASVAGGQAVTTAKQWLRLRVSGTTIQFRTWRDGTTEPSAWAGSVTDPSVIPAGQLFVSIVSGAANSVAKSVSLDDLTLSQA